MIFAGGGALVENIKKLVYELKISDKVFFKGWVTPEGAKDLLEEADYFVHHSVTSKNGDTEGMPNAIIEAMSMELPVVSTIHSGITENVVDNVTGYLVQEHNYEAMAEKIIYLIQNLEVAEQMGKQGRLRIQELCKQEKRIKMIKQLLSKVSSKSSFKKVE